MKNRMYCTFEIITNSPIEKLENKKALERKIWTAGTKFLIEELEYKIKKWFHKAEQEFNGSAIEKGKKMRGSY